MQRHADEKRVDHAFVSLRAVSKSYGAVQALDGIDLDLFAGELAAVVGPSGSGKSTCSNIIGCLDTPTSGSCRIAGQETSSLDAHRRAVLRRELIGFVFQSFNLLPRATALQNVALPLAYRKVGWAEAGRRARAALEAVGLGDRARHLPGELSGGQQQRVAIARALVYEPRIVIADEPTAALDRNTGRGVMALLCDLNRRHGITVLLVTHDQEVADKADRIITFSDGMIVSNRHRHGLEAC